MSNRTPLLGFIISVCIIVVAKGLGGAKRISRIGDPRMSVNALIDYTWSSIVHYYIYHFFILFILRNQIDLKPRKIIGIMKSKFNISVLYMKA